MSGRINDPDIEVDTPLHGLLWDWRLVAHQFDDESTLLEEIKLLLAQGADPNAKCVLWTTPFQVACAGHSVAVLKLLANAGAQLNGIDEGRSGAPFSTALSYERWPAAEWLVARGATKPQCRLLLLLRERWRVRWLLVWVMRKRYRLPVAIVRNVMQWI